MVSNDVHNSPYLLHHVYCSGNEDWLLNCSYRRMYPLESLQFVHYIYFDYISSPSVLCQGSINQSDTLNECISGEIRLANTSNNVEGRVMICAEGTWVNVCGGEWRKVETYLFCKQLLGHPAEGMIV